MGGGTKEVYPFDGARLWECKKCGKQWLCGPGLPGPPSRCYGDCGHTEFVEIYEINVSDLKG